MEAVETPKHEKARLEPVSLFSLGDLHHGQSLELTRPVVVIKDTEGRVHLGTKEK